MNHFKNGSAGVEVIPSDLVYILLFILDVQALFVASCCSIKGTLYMFMVHGPQDQVLVDNLKLKLELTRIGVTPVLASSSSLPTPFTLGITLLPTYLCLPNTLVFCQLPSFF